MTTITTATSANAWSPDVTALAPAATVPDALILQCSTQLATVEGDDVAVRAAFIDDDNETEFVPEGQAINKTEPTLSEVLIFTAKLARLAAVSSEQYKQTMTAQNLADSLRRALTVKANQAFLAQPAPADNAVTPPAGLLNIPGIIDGGTLDTDLDVLADVLAVLQTNYANPTHIIAAPSAWATLRKLKQADTWNASLLGAGTQDAQPFLFSLPVIVNPAMPADKLLILDKSAVVSAVGQVMVATSADLLFDEDNIAVRATWRFGQAVVHPDRLAVVTVAGADVEDEKPPVKP